MKYIKVFNEHSEYETFADSDDMLRPNVSHCISENEVHYNPTTYADKYLTFTALEDGTFKFSGVTANTLSYSLDNGATWTNLAHNTDTPTVTSGNKILWKGENLTINVYNGIGKFISTGQFNVEGNVMSLHYGDNFAVQTDLTGKDTAFRYLFKGCISLVSAENISLPATTLAQNCYSYMFAGCTSLTTAPELPAMTLAVSAYTYMFEDCTSLVNAPVLPATTLATSCYASMFDGCSSLTTAPELPATTLADNCYLSMFSGCTSLTTAPALPATTLASNCYNKMFYRCTSFTTAPELPATTLAYGCYSQMFVSCKNLTTPPALPVTTLADSCYYRMFYGCTSLTTAPELPATTLVKGCYEGMFNGCTNLNYIKMLATDISATYCLYNWVQNVASTGTFVKNAAMTSLPTGTSGIPTGWTVQDASS